MEYEYIYTAHCIFSLPEGAISALFVPNRPLRGGDWIDMNGKQQRPATSKSTHTWKHMASLKSNTKKDTNFQRRATRV